MICLRRKKYEKIINHLIQEYHSRHHQETIQRIAEVAQDHISRGLANSTVVVTKKLAVKYDYIDKLIDSLFQSMERDFPKLSLKDCKDILLNVTSIEYKKLSSCANNWLREANLLQQSMITQYETGIHKRLEETKKSIENRCELSNEKQKQKKWLDDPTHRWMVTTVIATLIAVIGWSFTIIDWVFKPNTPKPPNLDLHFAESASKSKEIDITGPFGKELYKVPLRLTLVNSTNRTAEDAWLTFITTRNITITSDDPRAKSSIDGSGESAKNRIDIPLDTIHPTGFGKLSNCNVELRWSSISIIHSVHSLHPPFVSNEITNDIEEFIIEGEIKAKDMPAAKMKLKINIGVREAFNAIGYKGEIFEINDKNELIKTSL
jgi:hypothetical protein